MKTLRNYVLSRIFYWYNYCKKKGPYERGRLNRALGLCLSGRNRAERVHEYGTTWEDCYCPDRQERMQFCKHMIAFRIMCSVWNDVQRDIDDILLWKV